MGTLLYVLLEWLSGFVLVWRLPRCGNGSDEAETGTALSIIVPARNEEGSLPRLLDSLAKQTVKARELIVVDDDSEDETPRLAREAGATVIDPGPLPAGWVGKPWACWQGARAAKGDILLFLDADTELAPQGLERLIAAYRSQKKGILSVYPYHFMSRSYERLSLFFNLVSLMSMGMGTLLGRRLQVLGAFGACVLCNREDYFRCDGHRAVRGEVMEDIRLGQRFLSEGLPVRCLVGKGTIRFRMYSGGIGQILEGWSKNFASGARASNPLILFIVLAWIFGAFETLRISTIALLGESPLPMPLVVGLHAAYALQIYWMGRRIGNFGMLSAALFPVPLVFFACVFAYSLVLTFLFRRVRWRGRSIPLKRRPEGT
jgi:4,4'-diaponeurosporenoate glycosyltransferase